MQHIRYLDQFVCIQTLVFDAFHLFRFDLHNSVSIKYVSTAVVAIDTEMLNMKCIPTVPVKVNIKH